MTRKYTAFDLLRFLRFKEKNKELKPVELIKQYSEKYPELSSKEKLINLSKALVLNGLHKAMTGKDIDKNDEFYKA